MLQKKYFYVNFPDIFHYSKFFQKNLEYHHGSTNERTKRKFSETA